MNNIIRKSAQTTKGLVTPEELALINKQALTPLEADAVFTIRIAACNDSVDRDYEHFSVSALEELAELYVGKTVIFDHAWTAAGQTARIYAASVEAEASVKRLVLRAYMLRTEKTAETIAAIEGGILREVSVGCRVRKHICDICGAVQEEKACPHYPGMEYNGKICTVTLEDALDAYEVSFVAVPAQPGAGLIKHAHPADNWKEQAILRLRSEKARSWRTKGEAMDIKQMYYQAKADRAAHLARAEEALSNGNNAAHEAAMACVLEKNSEISRLEKLLQEQERFGGTKDAAPMLGTSQGMVADAALKELAKAAKTGFQLTKAAGDYMQEGVNADGGYLVPQDVVTRIFALIESQDSLLGEITNTPVTTNSGARTYKKRASLTGFSVVGEGAAMGKVATPQFDRVTYSIKKRAGYTAATEEELADSDENVAQVIMRWLADEARVTINKAVEAAIKTKTNTDLTDLDGIVNAWLSLGPGFRSISAIHTNTDGLAWLASLKDENKRPLLNPNPNEPSKLQLCVGGFTIPVKEWDNATLTNAVTEASGTVTSCKVPFIIGSLREGIQRFDRQQLTITDSTQASVGGINAFEMGIHLFRGCMRDDVVIRDGDAFVRGYIDTVA